MLYKPAYLAIGLMALGSSIFIQFLFGITSFMPAVLWHVWNLSVVAACFSMFRWIERN
ncbi:hypothetical protein LCGC14_1666970 [marine sediment metagenome]|uniref:Uncharacterized protein n=1 Tax=marine sediment metagenome TaxID=412755 RepID=A0A0F9K885_9ZZZZ